MVMSVACVDVRPAGGTEGGVLIADPWPRSCRPHHASESSIDQTFASAHREISAAKSRAVCGRFARDFSKHAKSAASSSGGIGVRTRSEGGTGGVVTCFWHKSTTLSASNTGCPVKRKYPTAPTAYKSLRASTEFGS